MTRRRRRKMRKRKLLENAQNAQNRVYRTEFLSDITPYYETFDEYIYGVYL